MSAGLAQLSPARCCVSASDCQELSPAASDASRRHDDEDPLRLRQRPLCPRGTLLCPLGWVMEGRLLLHAGWLVTGCCTSGSCTRSGTAVALAASSTSGESQVSVTVISHTIPTKKNSIHFVVLDFNTSSSIQHFSLLGRWYLNTPAVEASFAWADFVDDDI